MRKVDIKKYTPPGIYVTEKMENSSCGNICKDIPEFTEESLINLNEFLIKLGSAECVGIRKKIVTLKKYLIAIGALKINN